MLEQLTVKGVVYSMCFFTVVNILVPRDTGVVYYDDRLYRRPCILCEANPFSVFFYINI